MSPVSRMKPSVLPSPAKTSNSVANSQAWTFSQPSCSVTMLEQSRLTVDRKRGSHDVSSTSDEDDSSAFSGFCGRDSTVGDHLVSWLILDVLEPSCRSATTLSRIAGSVGPGIAQGTSLPIFLANEQNNSTGDGLAYSPLGPSNGGHCSTKLGQAPEEEAMITAGSGVDDRAELADEGSHTIEGTGSGLAVAPTIAQEKGHHHLHHNHHHLNHHHSHGHCHGEEEAVEGVKEAGVSSIAWMVILGDGVHNLSDGLAIGAAFTIGFGSGLSTSIAVFCHELPHELGDFAVLLKAGMTVRQAIVYNLLSASLGYLGMIIGTAVGQYTHTVTLWIFAITAGMFLYVALVDMLPEMLHCEVCSHIYGRLGCFLLQNLGLLVGFAAMLLIALYEESILVSIRC
uniref:zinc transporter ZIP6-like n=1 Tax=Myxine glutinosa TaxID=7769 RepID=UPI00358FDA45